MTDSATTTPARTRAAAPDLARGFMLLLIAIANVSVYLWGHDTSVATLHPVDGTVLDRVLATLTIVFVDARIYPMFAFLFGYGMVQFAASRWARGVPEPTVRRMLRRRHLWLIAFGFVHAALLFAGDILGAYGLAGLVLTAIFFRRSDRALRITVWVFVAIIGSSALMSVLGGVLVAALPPELMADADAFAFGSTADLLTGQTPYGWAMLVRIGLWAASTVGVVLFLVVPGAILLGWLAARHRFLEEARHRPRLGAVAAWGITIGTIGAIPQALVYLGLLPLFENAEWAFSGIVQLTGLAGGVGYAALFGLIGLRVRDRMPGFLRAVAAVGKRSLSFYLLQSVIFAPLLSAWGLGLGARIGTAWAFAIAVGVWALSLVLAVALEARGARGPAEVLLRRLTYRRDDAPAPPSA